MSKTDKIEEKATPLRTTYLSKEYTIFSLLEIERYVERVRASLISIFEMKKRVVEGILNQQLIRCRPKRDPSTING